jgi:D-sedoheptulose 7-phosphate isomerase
VTDVQSTVEQWMRESAAVQLRVPEACGKQIAAAVELLVAAFKRGDKLLLCGNGGSAADCQHVATELVSRLSSDFERPALPALALTTDTSFLTAFGNDYGFAGVFRRQVEALGRPGDALLAVSTSGRSENVRLAVAAARERGMATIGLLGDGGPLAGEVDVAIVIPTRDTQHIQEAMLSVEHLMCSLVERAMFGGPEG